MFPSIQFNFLDVLSSFNAHRFLNKKLFYGNQKSSKKAPHIEGQRSQAVLCLVEATSFSRHTVPISFSNELLMSK